jgi:hypothetical protein
VLENESVRLGDVTVLGATLWTDFALDGNPVLAELTAQVGMTDFRRIRTLPHYRRLRPMDTRRLHLQSRRRLEEQVADGKGGKLVIVTHHAPSRRSIAPHFAQDPLNPAFASALDVFVAESGAKLWVHGHLHQCSDYTLGTTRVLANPRGYPDELQHGFDPGLVAEV